MELEKLRNDIDKVDLELLNILQKRFDVINEISIYKKNNWLIAHQPKRWQEVLIARKSIAEEKWLNTEMIEDIWNILHKYAILEEEKIIK